MLLAPFSNVRVGRSGRLCTRPRHGFSILELVVVLVLVGIVGVISTGRISAMRAEQRVVRSAGVIQTQMEQAFALAGRNHVPMHIVWNSTTMLLRVMDRSEATTYGTTNLSNSGFGLHASEITVSRNSTEVYPNGFANDTLSITITTQRGGTTYSKRVRMSRAGLVKVI
jgi:prepilin-type N-terminal cleavage/methylation domain-containing protein